MLKQLTLAAAVAVAYFTTAPAFAAASSSARLWPLAIDLVDLDPDDGVTPSVTFWSRGPDPMWPPIANYGWARALQTASGGWAHDFQDSMPFTPGDAAAQAGWTVSYASLMVLSSGDAAGAGLFAEGGASDFLRPEDGAYASFNAGVVALAGTDSFGNGAGFSLSANTRLVISGEARIEGAATWTGHEPGRDDQVSTSVRMEIKGLDGSQQAIEELAYADFATVSRTSFDFSYSRTLQLSFENLTDAAVDGTLINRVYVEGTTYAMPSPVPEPGTLSLLAGGLAVIGCIARCRHRT